MPIEPEASTVLLDKIMTIEEVCYASVPGAGGDDAIFVLGKPGVREKLQELLSERIDLAELPVDILHGKSLTLS